MSNKGFTLIELLVVISIIGLLASVVLASIDSVRGKAKSIQRVQVTSELTKAIYIYYEENGTFPYASGNPIASYCIFIPEGETCNHSGHTTDNAQLNAMFESVLPSGLKISPFEALGEYINTPIYGCLEFSGGRCVNAWLEVFLEGSDVACPRSWGAEVREVSQEGIYTACDIRFYID